MKNLFQRVLVPFDFSPQSRRALAVACDLAATHHGAVSVLCALEPVNSLAGIRPPSGPIWFPSDEVVAAERRRLQAIVDSVRAGRRLAVRATVVVAAPLEAILAAAKSADVIVLATTGRSALSHLLVGSVAEKVVRHAPVPVLTIGRGAAKRVARGRRAQTRAA